MTDLYIRAMDAMYQVIARSLDAPHVPSLGSSCKQPHM